MKSIVILLAMIGTILSSVYDQSNAGIGTFAVTDNRKQSYDEIGFPNDYEQLFFVNEQVFLEEFGFGDSKPFYQYVTEDGECLLALYYNESQAMGCGIRYFPQMERENAGFLFDGIEGSDISWITERMDEEVYSFLSIEGTDGKYDVEDYEEIITYTESGKIASYKSQGWITWLTEEKETSTILEMNFYYRENDTLKQKHYYHNSMVFGTLFTTKDSYYDEQERLEYEKGYITHGSLEYFYIYGEKSDARPDYCLVIDHNLNLLCAELYSYGDKD